MKVYLMDDLAAFTWPYLSKQSYDQILGDRGVQVSNIPVQWK